MRVLVPLAARTADRVITDSQAAAADVRRYLGSPRAPGRRRARRRRLADVHAAEPEAVLRARHDLGERQVVLSVSAKRPHKNLMRLLEALAAIDARAAPGRRHSRLPTPYEAVLRERAETLGVLGDMRFLDWVSGPELEGLYALSAAFVFPSLFEGFGLPVLEAMRRGVPVACSDRSSLPEVAGDAALLFDPDDPQAIRVAIERILGDPAEAERLRAAGREQAARFTWAATARGTASSYDRAMAGTSPRGVTRTTHAC